MLGAAACVPPADASKRSLVTVDSLIEQGRARGVPLENPFEIDDEIKAEVDKYVGLGGTPVERLRRIIRFMNDRGYVNFHYASNLSLTAKESFRAKRGDCLSYTNLYLGIARHLKIPAYFVHVSEARNYYEREGFFFVSSHMAVGYGGGAIGLGKDPYTMIVDFTQENSDWNLYLYQSIDDAKAVVLFYNNVAVDRMLEGDFQGAQDLLELLIDAKPDVREPYNNLAVLYLRQARYEEALEVLLKGLERHPGYQPYYTNAIQAARGARRPELAARFLEEGRRYADEDPFFLFNQGVTDFHKGAYGEAAEFFEAALKRQPQNPFLYAWLARVYMEEGQEQKGVKAFEEAQRLAPNHHMLEALREKYPVLGRVKPIG
jgi:tetratricopeptide (TPR) repeat protein